MRVRPIRVAPIFRTLAVLALGIAIGFAIAVVTEPRWPDVWRPAYHPARLPFNEERLRAALEAADRATQAATRTIGSSSEAAAGTALAQAIQFSRAQARGAATFPVPPALRERLAPYFPGPLLDKVRYNLAGRRVSLGSVLATWYYREGAVTLDDTVVFTNDHAAADIGLWAHELTHVQQYDELGVDGFSRLYAFNWQMLEREARANAGAVVADLDRHAPPDQDVFGRARSER